MQVDQVRDALSSEAYISGRHAGQHGLSPSLNPNPVGSFQYIEWEKGRSSAAAERAANSPARLPCQYQRGVSCDEYCRGRGMCLDVA